MTDPSPTPPPPPEFADAEILLGVTGGVAAYKAAELCSLLVQRGARVSAVLTAAAEQFIGHATFAALTNRPVHRELFNPVEHYKGEHIGLAERAQLLVVAPATAHFLGQAAHGLASDLLTTLVLANTGPLLIAPAMNAEMWRKGAVQRNVAQLEADGAVIIPPEQGWLSCRQVGPGRMASPAVILAAISEALRKLHRPT